jgi:PEP-CTERM motif
MKKIYPVLALLSAAAASQAITFNFVNLQSGSNVPSGQIATLSIVNTVANTVKFTLTANWNPTVYGSSVFLRSVKFNNSGASLSAGTYLSGNPIASFGNGGTDASLSFDNDVNFPTANGSGRFFLGESSSWTYTRAGLTASNFLAPMMVHIQGLTIPGADTSAKFTAVQSPEAVPEPATMAVLGLGLVPMLRRRLKRA